MFAKAADDERDLLLRDLGILAVRPKALGVELLERLPCKIEPALEAAVSLAGKDCSVSLMAAPYGKRARANKRFGAMPEATPKPYWGEG